MTPFWIPTGMTINFHHGSPGDLQGMRGIDPQVVFIKDASDTDLGNLAGKNPIPLHKKWPAKLFEGLIRMIRANEK